MAATDQDYLAAKERGVAQAQAVMRNLTVHWMDDTIHDIPLQRPHELAKAIADFATRLGV
jgi:broad specificity phosphatase PhoE